MYKIMQKHSLTTELSNEVFEIVVQCYHVDP